MSSSPAVVEMGSAASTTLIVRTGASSARAAATSRPRSWPNVDDHELSSWRKGNRLLRSTAANPGSDSGEVKNNEIRGREYPINAGGCPACPDNGTRLRPGVSLHGGFRDMLGRGGWSLFTPSRDDRRRRGGCWWAAIDRIEARLDRRGLKGRRHG